MLPCGSWCSAVRCLQAPHRFKIKIRSSLLFDFVPIIERAARMLAVTLESSWVRSPGGLAAPAMASVWNVAELLILCPKEAQNTRGKIAGGAVCQDRFAVDSWSSKLGA